jgi:hypothetical protein
LIQFFTFDCTNAISQIAAFTGLVRNPAERKTDHGTQSHKCLILQRVPDMLSIASMNADPAYRHRYRVNDIRAAALAAAQRLCPIITFPDSLLRASR